MEGYIRYINTQLPDIRGDRVMYKFKKKTLDEMKARALEVRARGLTNQTVIDDLIKSEHPDLKEEYRIYSGKDRRQRNARRNLLALVIGSVIYLLALVTVFLAVSFMTKRWSITWAIVVDGVLLWTDFLLLLGVVKLTAMRKIFHIFARILLAGAVVIFTVAVYLAIVALFDIPHSWLILIAGLMLMFVGDGIFAVVAKHRLAILSWLAYIPVTFTFIFILTGASHLIPWNTGWIMIPLSLILDLVIIFAALARNKTQRTEVAQAWKES